MVKSNIIEIWYLLMLTYKTSKRSILLVGIQYYSLVWWNQILRLIIVENSMEQWIYRWHWDWSVQCQFEVTYSEAVCTIFMVFGMTRPGREPRLTRFEK